VPVAGGLARGRLRRLSAWGEKSLRSEPLELVDRGQWSLHPLQGNSARGRPRCLSPWGEKSLRSKPLELIDLGKENPHLLQAAQRVDGFAAFLLEAKSRFAPNRLSSAILASIPAPLFSAALPDVQRAPAPCGSVRRQGRYRAPGLPAVAGH